MQLFTFAAEPKWIACNLHTQISSNSLLEGQPTLLKQRHAVVGLTATPQQAEHLPLPKYNADAIAKGKMPAYRTPVLLQQSQSVRHPLLQISIGL